MAIDISPITDVFTSAGVIVPVLQVVVVLGSIASFVMAVFGVLMMIRGDKALGDFYRVNRFRQDIGFQRRYDRERHNVEYRRWKKRKGY